MTDPERERMSEAEIDFLRTWLNEEECWCEKEKGECMPCQTRAYVTQLRTDLAAANARAERAEHAAAVNRNTLNIMQTQAMSHHAEIERVKNIGLGYAKERDTLRTQLAEAVEIIEDLRSVDYTDAYLRTVQDVCGFDEASASEVYSTHKRADDFLSRLTPDADASGEGVGNV